MNITLIGMPGSGKSFVGGKLAERLGYELIELDSLLEEEAGTPLPSIVEEWGRERFLAKQSDDAISYTKGRNDIVVSPGGSIIYSENAMKHLSDISKIIYLESPLHVIERRINEVPRGIIGMDEKSLAQIYAERVPMYEKWSDHTVDAARDADTVVDDILGILQY